jgi:nucleoside-diphosphate-sugar epimerase
MSKTRELVLGGDGLIGSALIAELQNRGHETISLDLKTGCDLRYVEDELFLNCDRVWFLAWDTGGAKYIEATDSQHQQYKHNCELSARVFDILARTGKPFLFISSQLAGLPTAYGATKFMAATWALQLGGKVARLWNVYGWEEPTVRSHVVTDLVLSGLKGRVSCMTDGGEQRRFLYKTDAVEALMRLFDSDRHTAEIAANDWVTIRSVGEEVARQLNVPMEFGELRGSECLIDPVETLPNWGPRVTLQQGISLVIADARAHLNKQHAAV